jgi:SAM-dependent methyltransferase
VKFIYKAILQNIFDILPSGINMNYLFQRYVSKGLPIADSEFEKKISIAKNHYDNYLKYRDDKNESPIFYEFGAGWDLIIPMSYYSLGVEKQCLVDIRNNLKLELINNTISRIPGLFNNNCVYPKVNIHRDINKYGISLHIPSDARNTGFEDNYFDFISNTDTLEHIPPNDIKEIFSECFRILKHGGVCSCMIDLVDHYSYFDNSISAFNFYGYTNEEWKRYNSSIHYQNRLRVSDYCEIVEASGFKITVKDQIIADAMEENKILGLKLAPEFEKYDLKDLIVKRLWLILKK